MKRKKLLLSGLIVVMGVFFALITYSQNDEQLNKITEKFQAFNEQTAGERVYLHFDKSMYQPGETIWFSAYLRNDKDLKVSELSDILHVELIDPKGNILKEIKLISKDGLTEGDFILDEKLANGMYKVKAYTEWQKNDKESFIFSKDIKLQKLILPTLILKLEYSKKVYGEGELAKAEIELKDISGRPIANQKIYWDASIKGEKIASRNSKTDESGKAIIEFRLPDQLTTANGMINMSIDYSGIREFVLKQIPIERNRIQFELYPEGGDLVDGQKTQIAFQALNEKGQGRDVKGKIVDIDGNSITSFESFHDGMGVFSVVPNLNEEYFVSVIEPAGIKELFPLPMVVKKGYSLTVLSSSDETIAVKVQSSNSNEISLVVQVRGEIYHSERYSVSSGENLINIASPAFPIGVAQITLFDGKGIARAERLVFVNKHKQLNIELSTDKEQYETREKVTLSLKITDENNVPVKGSFSTAIIDDNLNSMYRDNSGKILSKLLLEPDLSGTIHNPSFYFDKANPKAEIALDYLLMTRGWRRFSWKEMLSNKEPQLAYKKEKAIIEGYLYNTKLKHPVKNGKIKIDEMDLTVKADKTGYFRIEGVDLSEKIKFQYRDITRNFSNFIVADYNGMLYIDVSKDYKFKEVQPNEMGKSSDQNVYVSSGNSAIKGQIIDVKDKKPIPYANIIAEVDGNMVAGTTADFEGNYVIKSLPPGKFDIKASCMGYFNHMIKGVQVKSKQYLYLNIDLDESAKLTEEIVADDIIDKELVEDQIIISAMQKDKNRIVSKMLNQAYYQVSDLNLVSNNNSKRKRIREEKVAGVEIDGVTVSAFKKPLIDIDQTISGGWYTEEEIKRMPVRSGEGIAANTGGVFSLDGEMGNIRGSRMGETAVFIDGVRVIGSSNVPEGAIAEVSVYLSGVPAEYGDFRGGVIEITTKSAFTNFSYAPREQEDETIEIPAIAVYHRAREFPQVNYENTGEEDQKLDIRTTIFWEGDVELDENGKAILEFTTSDAETNFRMEIEGLSDEGIIGRAEKTFLSESNR